MREGEWWFSPNWESRRGKCDTCGIRMRKNNKDTAPCSTGIIPTEGMTNAYRLVCQTCQRKAQKKIKYSNL